MLFLLLFRMGVAMSRLVAMGRGYVIYGRM